MVVGIVSPNHVHNMRTSMRALLAGPILACLLAAACSSSEGFVRGGPSFDLIIQGGEVVDGSGDPRFRADVGVVGDRIEAVGDLSGRSAKRHVDARGMIVAPGFIDMLGWSEYSVLVDPRA